MTVAATREQTVRDTADGLVQAAEEAAHEGGSLPLTDERFARKVAQIRAALAAEHGPGDARRITSEAMAAVREAVQPKTVCGCGCGRRLRYLNAASGRPACEGCGFDQTNCRCQLLTE